MSERVANAVVAAVAVVLYLLSTAYMYFHRAPSVVEVRPELVDVGFWTALFSGRFNPWLWYHHPTIGAVLYGLIYGVPLMWVLRQ